MTSVNTIIEEVKQLIKIDCRNRILNRHLLLTKEDLINNAEPEEFTKVHLIEP